MAIKISLSKLRLPESLSQVINKADKEVIQLIGVNTNYILNV
jgi:hypothetical protein